MSAARAVVGRNRISHTRRLRFTISKLVRTSINFFSSLTSVTRRGSIAALIEIFFEIRRLLSRKQASKRVDFSRALRVFFLKALRAHSALTRMLGLTSMVAKRAMHAILLSSTAFSVSRKAKAFKKNLARALSMTKAKLAIVSVAPKKLISKRLISSNFFSSKGYFSATSTSLLRLKSLLLSLKHRARTQVTNAMPAFIGARKFYGGYPSLLTRGVMLSGRAVDTSLFSCIPGLTVFRKFSMFNDMGLTPDFSVFSADYFQARLLSNLGRIGAQTSLSLRLFSQLFRGLPLLPKATGPLLDISTVGVDSTRFSGLAVNLLGKFDSYLQRTFTDFLLNYRASPAVEASTFSFLPVATSFIVTLLAVFCSDCKTIFPLASINASIKFLGLSVSQFNTIVTQRLLTLNRALTDLLIGAYLTARKLALNLEDGIVALNYTSSSDILQKIERFRPGNPTFSSFFAKTRLIVRLRKDLAVENFDDAQSLFDPFALPAVELAPNSPVYAESKGSSLFVRSLITSVQLKRYASWVFRTFVTKSLKPLSFKRLALKRKIAYRNFYSNVKRARRRRVFFKKTRIPVRDRRNMKFRRFALLRKTKALTH